VSEWIDPVLPGRMGYFIMCSSMVGVGLALAFSVEFFARRFVRSVHLLSGGKHLRFTFHTAYTVKNT